MHTEHFSFSSEQRNAAIIGVIYGLMLLLIGHPIATVMATATLLVSALSLSMWLSLVQLAREEARRYHALRCRQTPVISD